MQHDLVVFAEKQIGSPNGSFLIDRYWLTNASSDEFIVAESFLYELIEKHPEYEFWSSDDFFSGGIKIYWNLKNTLTEKN